MNIPNKLTLFRVILIPVFMCFYLLSYQWSLISALIVFVVACLTDQLDGHLARKNNQITTFGKLMDPLADKLLVLSAFVCFLSKGVVFFSAPVVMIFLARELIVTGIRMLALNENRTIAASMSGKIKTTLQMVLIISVLVFGIAAKYLPSFVFVFDILTKIEVVAAALVTLYSGVEYVVKNKDIITFK